MIALLSPAKNLNANAKPVANGGVPAFITDAGYLAGKLKKRSARSLGKMMNINADLGALNFQRYQDWQFPFPKGEAFPSIHLFAGDVYRGFDASSLNEKELAFAHDHVFILSGLYGLLRPLDSMMPYRLEMGTRWAVTPAKKNLYAYWGARITEHIDSALREQNSDVLLNLASNEYFKAVKPALLDARVVTPVFKEKKGGDYKVVMTYAKLARGQMCRFMVQNGITSVEDMKGFDLDGYQWNKQLSTENEWAFTRG